MDAGGGQGNEPAAPPKDTKPEGGPLTPTLAEQWLSWPAGIARLGVTFLILTTTVGLAWRYPHAIHDLGALATSNSELSYRDREIAGGNSVVADQRIVTEARTRIPERDSFAVLVGEPRDSWSSLTATFATTFLRSSLLPRRLDPDGRWVICYACDRAQLADARTVWEGAEGISLLQRRP